MKVTIELNENLVTPLLQEHLETGIAVKRQIAAAVAFFLDMRKHEREGKGIGFGDGSRFATYNTPVSPMKYLQNAE